MKDSSRFTYNASRMLSPPWENAALCSADPSCVGFKAVK
jgi:hypothetical protein